MKPAPLAYSRADDVPHALALWQEAGPEAKLLAGGQSLIAALNLRLTDAPGLIDVGRITSLRGISERDDRLVIGALTRHADLETDPLVARHAPLLTEAAPLIAHPAIRTRGTIGGSLAYADPAAELPACMLALDAEIVAQGAGGERRIAARDFFTGVFETSLRPFEMIVAIEVPKLAAGRRQAVRELARRSGDYAIVGLCIAAGSPRGPLDDIRISLFGVGGTPILAQAAMAAITEGRDEAAIAAALDDDLDPADDLQASAAMKRHLARVLLRRTLAELGDQA